jgi:hypothetical protein
VNIYAHLEGRTVRVVFGVEQTVRAKVIGVNWPWLQLQPVEWDQQTEARFVNVSNAQMIEVLNEEK